MKILAWLSKRPGASEGPLARIPLFDGLSGRERRRVEQTMRFRTCPPGASIFQEGERDGHLHVVLEGRVRIAQPAPGASPVDLGPGDFFGETALIADVPRSASAVAAEAVRLMSLSRADFLRLCDRHPHIGVQIAIHLSQVVAERLRQTNHRLKEVQARAPRGEGEVPEESEILRHRTGGQP